MNVLKSEVQLIIRYLFLLIKSVILWVILSLDLFGILLTYQTEYTIPSWILFSIPSLGIIIASYKIFKNSSPKIDIEKPGEEDYNINFPYDFTYNTFNIQFDTYIRNFGLQSGSLESINFRFVGINGIRDEFILRNMEISNGDFVISNQNHGFPLIELKREYQLKFPMILKPDTMIPIYIQVPISVSNSTEGNEELLKWIEKIYFELEYKFRDGFGTEVRKVPFMFKVNMLPKIAEEVEETRKRVKEYLEGIGGNANKS